MPSVGAPNAQFTFDSYLQPNDVVVNQVDGNRQTVCVDKTARAYGVSSKCSVYCTYALAMRSTTIINVDDLAADCITAAT